MKSLFFISLFLFAINAVDYRSQVIYNPTEEDSPVTILAGDSKENKEGMLLSFY
jgi:hypothetical protein